MRHPTRASKRARVAEVAFIVLLTLGICFWVPVAIGCRTLNDAPHGPRELSASSSGPPDLSGGICPEGQYSDLGFILLQPKEEAVKALFSRSMAFGAELRIPILLGCFVIVYALTLITFGSAVPCGLFIPNILSGACLGRALGEALLKYGYDVHPGVYALVGSTGMLSGFSRMTIALGMIMMEITNNMKMILPVIVVILFNKVVADYFNDGVNHMLLHSNVDVHLLADNLGEDNLLVLEGLTVHDTCVSEVVVLHALEPIGQIMSLLMSSSFQGYPVVGDNDRLITVVSRVQLVSALAMYDPREGSLVDVKKLAEGGVPDIAPWNTPVSKAYHHFRSSGLQHLCVIDDSYMLVGILTRTDLARFCGLRREGVDNIRAVINRRDALTAAGGHRLKLSPIQLSSLNEDQDSSEDYSEMSDSYASSSQGTPLGTPRTELDQLFPNFNQPGDPMSPVPGTQGGTRLEGDAAAGEGRGRKVTPTLRSSTTVQNL